MKAFVHHLNRLARTYCGIAWSAPLARAGCQAAWLALAASLLGGGCVNVKPWQRGALADPTMRLDRNRLSSAMSEHMWFSRETATGGRGVGGGGCGCN